MSVANMFHTAYIEFDNFLLIEINEIKFFRCHGNHNYESFFLNCHVVNDNQIGQGLGSGTTSPAQINTKSLIAIPQYTYIMHLTL